MLTASLPVEANSVLARIAFKIPLKKTRLDMNRRLIFLCILLFAQSCSIPTAELEEFDIQGHRGCKGLMPENSIPGFLKAVELGVDTLEMDVVITQDDQVIVSHEPYMSGKICLDRMNQEIPEGREKAYNIYRMNYEEVELYDCGSKPLDGYPQQEKLPTTKPLLTDVIQAVDSYAQEKGLTPIKFNIEIKSRPEGDGIYHPKPNRFARLVLDAIKQVGITARSTIQSFDARSLRAVKAFETSAQTAYLINNELSPEENLEGLGFEPDIYSPQHALVNEEMLRILHGRGIKVIPWTVNDSKDMKRLIELGVDGIISDYPDRLVKVVARPE